MSLSHESPVAGHLGINKTYHKALIHFYWPKTKQDVAQFSRTCYVCQIVGNLNNPISVAPLKHISVCRKPFSDIIINCVGPLPKTKPRNKYLLHLVPGKHQ